MYRGSPFRSTLNTSYITGLHMCKVCTEAVHSVECYMCAKTTERRKNSIFLHVANSSGSKNNTSELVTCCWYHSAIRTIQCFSTTSHWASPTKSVFVLGRERLERHCTCTYDSKTCFTVSNSDPTSRSNAPKIFRGYSSLFTDLSRIFLSPLTSHFS